MTLRHHRAEKVTSQSRKDFTSHCREQGWRHWCRYGHIQQVTLRHRADRKQRWRHWCHHGHIQQVTSWRYVTEQTNTAATQMTWRSAWHDVTSCVQMKTACRKHGHIQKMTTVTRVITECTQTLMLCPPPPPPPPRHITKSSPDKHCCSSFPTSVMSFTTCFEATAALFPCWTDYTTSLRLTCLVFLLAITTGLVSPTTNIYSK